jgi:hypothetical protein
MFYNAGYTETPGSLQLQQDNITVAYPDCKTILA